MDFIAFALQAPQQAEFRQADAVWAGEQQGTDHAGKAASGGAAFVERESRQGHIPEFRLVGREWCEGRREVQLLAVELSHAEPPHAPDGLRDCRPNLASQWVMAACAQRRCRCVGRQPVRAPRAGAGTREVRWVVLRRYAGVDGVLRRQLCGSGASWRADLHARPNAVACHDGAGDAAFRVVGDDVYRLSIHRSTSRVPLPRWITSARDARRGIS